MSIESVVNRMRGRRRSTQDDRPNVRPGHKIRMSDGVTPTSGAGTSASTECTCGLRFRHGRAKFFAHWKCYPPRQYLCVQQARCILDRSHPASLNCIRHPSASCLCWTAACFSTGQKTAHAKLLPSLVRHRHRRPRWLQSTLDCVSLSRLPWISNLCAACKRKKSMLAFCGLSAKYDLAPVTNR